MKCIKIRAAASFLVLCVLSVALLPVTARAAETAPMVQAGSYIVMDAKTGQVILSQGAHTESYPASITKIFTMAMVLDACRDDSSALNQQITVSNAAITSLIYNAATVWLKEGEVVSLRDLLYTSQVRSANDSANMLAEFTSGSIADFSSAMTQKAQSLGLSGTYFTNPSGLPDPNHVTTAYDMAAITRWALTVPGFQELFSATSYNMQPTNMQTDVRQLSTTNEMMKSGSFWNYVGITGGKTGFTNDAQFTMVTTARRGDTELICVVLRCPTNDIKYESTRTLLDYCFNNFASVSLPAQSFATQTVPVYGGGANSLGDIDVQGGADISVLLHKSLSLADITVAYDIPSRYVIGASFAPTARITLSSDMPFQDTQLLNVPLSWTGLDEILSAHTIDAQARVRKEAPVAVWVVVGFISILAFVLTARVLYVRRRRSKRRAARLASVKSQMPIRVANRPPPPAPRRSDVRTHYRAGQSSVASRQPVNLKVVRGAPPYVQRRAGREQ